MPDFLGYGSAKALSVSHDYQKDIDNLYRREAYSQQVKSERERKAQYYASLMKEQTSSAPYNTRRLETFYSDLNNKTAEFAINNPGFESDVSKMHKFLEITDQYINNPIIQEDMQVQKAWESTKEAAQKGNIKQDEYYDMAEKYHNYINQKDGSVEQYQFVPPVRKDIFEIASDVDKFLKPVDRDVTDPKTRRIIRTSEYPDENVHVAAITILRDKENNYVFNKAFNELDPKTKGVYNSLVDYTEHVLKLGLEKKKIDQGYDALFQYGQEQQMKKQYSFANYNRFYYNNVYEPLMKGQDVPAHPANIALTEFVEPGKPLTMGPSGRNFKLYGKDNQIETINVKGHIVGLGGGEIVRIGNVPWVKTQVAVGLDDKQIAFDTSGKPIESQLSEQQKAEMKQVSGKDAVNNIIQKTYMSKVLQDHGFNMQKVTDPGLLSGLGISAQNLTTDVYVGTILMPANFSEANRESYDKHFNTAEKIAEAAPLYQQDMNIYEAIKTNNIPVVNSIINQSVGQDISAQTGIDVNDLSWSSKVPETTDAEEDPSIWYATDGKTNFKYDFNTGKWYHKPVSK